MFDSEVWINSKSVNVIGSAFVIFLSSSLESVCDTCCGLPSLLDLTRLQDPKVSVPFYVEKLVISHGTEKETG